VSDYIELGARSAFSFLHGASLPEDLATRAVELGYPSLALCDRDGVYGAPRFFQGMRTVDDKARAICGADVGIGAAGPRIRLLCRDRGGYQNLCRLLTAAKAGREKGQSLVTSEMLEAHAAGLVALASPDAARPPLLDALSGIFGRQLFLEVHRHLDPVEERRTQVTVALARSQGYQLVATNDVTYARAADSDLADVLTCIREKVPLDRAGRRLGKNAERYLKSPSEMAALFHDLPDAVANTVEIAGRCNFTLKDLGYRFPDSPVPGGHSQQSWLRHLVEEGARRRYRPMTEAAATQLRRELDLIGKLDLAGYFLIVWDLVEFCRQRGIMCQGRGSAANSAVCYALGITAVDPVGMELLFERFLSEERGEWPDIDLDLPSGDRREEVIQYVYRRYSQVDGVTAPRVAMTANCITYRTRSAVREVGKTLGFSIDRLERLASSLSPFAYHTDDEELAVLLEKAQFSIKEPRVKQLLRLSQAVQGLPRHLGQHSGGMVLCHGRLDEVVPLEPASMPGRVVVQWDKDDCADLGLIKVDLLGLGMMAVLEEVVPMIKRYERVDIDLAQLPKDDPTTYDMLCAADTVGVFQVESRAQMATLPRMKPRKFYDLVIEVAIIRPGPIVGQMVHPFMARRAGRQPITYPHPSLEPILKRTLGVPLFQEQLMRLAMVAAGFTGGQAEELRRAMGHKRSVERMALLEKQLHDGMAARGIGPAARDEIVQSIRAFALYGFPESHAASFALLAYASAYLKAHHPAAFCAALLNNWPMGFYHTATLITDVKRHGVRVRPVDVNASDWKCTLEPEPLSARGWAIRLGLRYVAGLHQDTAERIVAGRPYASLADLSARARPSTAELGTLASVGALNQVANLTRRRAMWRAAAVGRSGALFDGVEAAGEPEEALAEMTLPERIVADYRGSGVTVGPHPVSLIRAPLDALGVVPAAQLGRLPHGSRARTGGAVIVRQRPGSAKGFYFATLEDETGFSNIIINPQLFAQERALLLTAPGLIIEGVVQNQDGAVAIKADRCRPLPALSTQVPSRDFH